MEFNKEKKIQNPIYSWGLQFSGCALPQIFSIKFNFQWNKKPRGHDISKDFADYNSIVPSLL